MGAPKFNRVSILGVGLIGGSLALDAKAAGWFGHVTGCGRSIENLKRAKAAGIVDEYTTDQVEAVRSADLVVLAAPVAAFITIAKEIARALKEGAIVTDVGSVKGKLVEELEAALGSRVKFVPAHPVAGSEKSGAAAAIRGMFKGRRCILTPTSRTDAQALEIIKGLWQALGMTVVMMDPYRHDILLAATSHLPHLVAYTLVETVLRIKEKEPDVLDFAVGGFHDFTRIAGSSPEMWRDIFLLNSKAVLEMLDRFDDVAKGLREMIRRQDGESLLRLFERSREAKLKTA